jgi:hypothetical protein
VRILALVVGFLILGTPAWAKPKVAVAPFKGDKNNKVADAISEALAGQVKVTEPKATSKAMEKLELGKDLDEGDAKKLAKKLEVDAIVQGKLEKDGKTQTLKVAIFQKGKEPVRFTVQFTKLNDKFREDVSGLIVKKIDDDNDEVEKKKKKDDDAEKKRLSENDDGEKKKKKDDDDGDKKRVAEVTDDDGETRIKKKKKKKTDDDDETPGARWAAARLDLGGFGGVRRLTYASNMVSPRPVGTRNTAAHVAGEVYPFAFGGKRGGAAGIGFAGEFEKTLGLAITIANGKAVPIDQGHFSLGARYRINAGSTLAVIIGTDFQKKRYVADRSDLASPGELDAPDTNYTAVVPSVGIAKMATPKVIVFGRAGGMLILDAGPIAKRDSYGAATVFGFDLKAGTDIAFSERVGLRLAGGFNQITFKFKGNGDLAMARGVTAAADRNFGVAATLGITY